MQKRLTYALCLLTGLVVIINSFFKLPGLQGFVTDYLQVGIQVSSTWALAVGGINLMRNHGRRVAQKKENWGYSSALIAMFLIYLTLGLGLQGNHQNPLYQQWLEAIPNSISATVMATLAFYIASAAFRAFRMRSMESTMLLSSALIVMMAMVPIGEAMVPGLPRASAWLMDVINTPALRAMTMGLTMGGITQSLRNLLGIEGR
jgi:cation transport ATPase